MARIKEWVEKLEVPSEPGLTNTQLMLTNHDLRPVEPERRQWKWFNFVAFWIADSLNINTWMISSSMIVDGLSWWQSWICVWVGYFIAACFVCLTGRIGAVYHISFPVVCRSTFGVWGSLWPVFNRAAMAVIWYGVQGYIGGQCVTLMISSIWPSYNRLPNSIPASSGVTTRDFVSFFIFWLLSLPALWFPVHKIRHLFTVKAIYSPIAAIAFFAWAIARAKGLGPIVHQPHTVHGSALAWAVVKAIMSCLGNFATLIVNDPDFSRFARKPKDALWSQLLTIPIGFGITSFIGIIASSSSAVIFGGEMVWNPLDLLGKFQVGASSAERFGIFIISTGFALAQLGTNISANSVSAGTDMTALLPRYLTIRRGSYICAAIGLAMNPWNLVSSSNSFTTYLSAYSIFLSSIAGPMICDYYIVRKGYLRVKELYTAREGSAYRFVYGFSWQAYASYIAGILVNIVGFAGAVGRTVPVGAQYIYNVNYFSGIFVSALMYYILTRLFPVPATSSTWSEVDQDVDSMSITYGEEVDAYDVPEPAKADTLNYGTLQERKGPKAGSSATV
ncbi:permease for cytosine/purines, uracil, thiamine, allantoin-domain-containing protein [Aspergillus pseudonomiae]|uniref:Permease for cytosine/purines, uracil, thiamine, allantoin-domain-containing protein n=1 Tax=Aspergillus pseudonomiae TaxID=1506151 RepID=A0A5N7D826_9EURO|nr:permease for cytosine/purines, uracil, thiamine, allantoin-domain-containing protein [Aspergillus pseudonomiae]KAB8265194.1 permease for cytosine/purines, uracil, thiamine, allantoin-domain-containing protein [Aspergillus pseudonomiae]KAE8402576.1 permease for cytosine/purines, uracil, thiamine, allantoin-domain-containing protein [Aspergillus pseudonomiae]